MSSFWCFNSCKINIQRAKICFYFSGMLKLRIFLSPPHLSNSFEFLISYFLPPVFASLDLITPASPQTPCQRWADSPGLRYSSSFFGHVSDLCLLSVLRIAGLNHAVCSVCDSPTEWLRGHHFQPVRDCRAAPPCQPVIISTRRPLFFSVARSLALSCSNRMITGC